MSTVALDRQAQDREVATWYAEHFDRIRRLSLRMLSDEAAAEDVAQEALIRAWSRRGDLTDHRNIGPWLTCVARNLCVDLIRRRSRFISLEEIDSTDPEAGPEHQSETNDERRDVRQAFSSISARHRKALYLREVEGVSIPTLAGSLGVGEVAARMVLCRARKALRNRLETFAEGVAALAILTRAKVDRWGSRLADTNWYPVAPILQAAAVILIASSSAPAIAKNAEPLVPAHGSLQNAQVVDAIGGLPARSTSSATSPWRAPSGRISNDPNGRRLRAEAGLSAPGTNERQTAWAEISMDDASALTNTKDLGARINAIPSVR